MALHAALVPGCAVQEYVGFGRKVLGPPPATSDEHRPERPVLLAVNEEAHGFLGQSRSRKPW